MAIYHLSAQVLGRRPKVQRDGSVRPGSSAVAAAAYRSGTRLKDEGRGEVHDYSRRKGIAHTEVMVPPGAADWLADRSLLWNTAEALEKRVDAQLCRELNIALPHELSHEQRLELVRGYVLENFVSRGMVADIALHDPVGGKSTSDRNYHAHIMLTLRQATERGLNPVKTREWNAKELMVQWRASWTRHCNDALASAGRKERIDDRTLVAQRQEAEGRGEFKKAASLRREPEIHVGPKARRAVERGWEARSSVREVGPEWHRRESGAGRSSVVSGRRQVDYGRIDQGPRLSWLESILVGNNVALREDILRSEQQAARFRRRMDHWEKRANFWLEGQIKGGQFRFDRMKAAQAERERKAEAARKHAHAAMRVAQVQRIIAMLMEALSGGRKAREHVLGRQRQVAGWSRPQVRGQDRTRGRRRDT